MAGVGTALDLGLVWAPLPPCPGTTGWRFDSKLLPYLCGEGPGPWAGGLRNHEDHTLTNSSIRPGEAETGDGLEERQDASVCLPR